MNNIIFSILIFMCSFHMAMGQNSAILKSNGLLETDFYHNEIVSYDNGFFALFNSKESKSSLILSKYDACNNHLWTKKYTSNFDLSLKDALVHNNKLIVLFVTHFNSSTTRTPILLGIDMSGEFEFSYRYNKNKFDNFINLSQYDNQYHIMGPSSSNPKGGGHFVMNDVGELIYTNVLSNTTNSFGSAFGCTVLRNGMVIRRQNNTLIACDNNQNVIWAKRIENPDLYFLSESKPLALDDGFIQFIKNYNELVLFKMDFNGNIVWSILGKGKYYNFQPVINENQISFFWPSLNSEGEYALNYTKLEQSDGTIILNKLIENDDGSTLSWPSISTNSRGDIFISGSVDGTKEDLIYINPHLSECILTPEGPKFTNYDIDLVDITDDYEIIPVSVSQDTVDFIISDMEPILSSECNRQEYLEIDASLDCNNTFVFDGNLYGSEFLWSDGKTDSLRTFTAFQEISVWVDSCHLEKEIHLNINESICNCQIYVPNIISSSALNSENQKLAIRSNCAFVDYSIDIFDRWGNLVFQSNDSTEPWYPLASDKLRQGVYTWLIKWSSARNPEIQINLGTITYLR